MPLPAAGAPLYDRAGGAVVAEAENTVETEHDCTGHAETNLDEARAVHNGFWGCVQ
eukprot:gene11966-27405_t